MKGTLPRRRERCSDIQCVPGVSHSPGCQALFQGSAGIQAIQGASRRWRAKEREGLGNWKLEERWEVREHGKQLSFSFHSLYSIEKEVVYSVESMQWKRRLYDRARDDARNCRWKLIGPTRMERGRAALSQEYWLEARCLEPVCHTVCTF